MLTDKIVLSNLSQVWFTTYQYGRESSLFHPLNSQSARANADFPPKNSFSSKNSGWDWIHWLSPICSGKTLGFVLIHAARRNTGNRPVRVRPECDFSILERLGNRLVDSATCNQSLTSVHQTCHAVGFVRWGQAQLFARCLYYVGWHRRCMSCVSLSKIPQSRPKCPSRISSNGLTQENNHEIIHLLIDQNKQQGAHVRCLRVRPTAPNHK